VSSVLSKKGLGEALQFLDLLQPVFMESLILKGFSVSLKDFNVPKAMFEEIHKSFQKQTVISESLFVEMRFKKKLKSVKIILLTFVFNYRLMSNYRLDLLINHGV
jgi:DNA-directed RNA polymerase-5 subunit 1